MPVTLRRMVALLGGLLLGACMSKTYATLIDAVRYEDRAAVREMIRAGTPLEAPDSSGQTPLLLAAKTDQFEIANDLLDAGADPLAPSEFGWTAAYAAQSSKIEGGPEFEARKAFIAKLEARGITFPVPRPAEVRAQMQGMAGNAS